MVSANQTKASQGTELENLQTEQTQWQVYISNSVWVNAGMA